MTKTVELTLDVCTGKHGDAFIFLPDEFEGKRVKVTITEVKK